MQTTNSNFLRAEAELILEEARRQKAKKTKFLGSPIELPGKPLSLCIRGSDAWIAESTAVARLVNMESGKTRRIFKGHTGPVTCLALYDDDKLLITGAWDMTIKIWDAEKKLLISSTPAHSDFVKCLLVIPSLQLLVSGSSDKIVRFWDLSTAREAKPLVSVGSISSHTRPIACLDGYALSETAAMLFTADSMGVIKAWDLTKEDGPSPRWRSSLNTELKEHRTGVNNMVYDGRQLWTASTDETVQIQNLPPTVGAKPIPPITHPVAVKSILPLASSEVAEPYLITGAGDVIRVYDMSSPEEPELLNEIDAHWHDVVALRLWRRTIVLENGKTSIEPWIVSASLDGTLRKWRLFDILKPTPVSEEAKTTALPEVSELEPQFQMTEDEEQELAELMADD